MSNWTHVICIECWNKRNPDKPNSSFTLWITKLETCCFCGEHTRDGIYIRANPEETKFCQHDKEGKNA